MKLLAVIFFVAYGTVGVVLALNGLQRIVAYSDWPQGLCNLGIGMMICSQVLSAFLED